MTGLPEFVVADPASPAWRSPLRHALAMPRHGIRDVSAEVGDAEADALGPAAGLAGIELEGNALMRRLTDLDLSQLPAAGKVAGVPALVSSLGGERYRIFFAQELGHSVVETVRDIQEGLQ